MKPHDSSPSAVEYPNDVCKIKMSQSTVRFVLCFAEQFPGFLEMMTDSSVVTHDGRSMNFDFFLFFRGEESFFGGSIK